MAEERLQKVMAEAGVASRRKSEKLIAEGHVKVNGRVVKELGTKVEQHDRIEVDEVPIQREQNVYFLLNKPRGVITSVSDDKNRKTVMDFFSRRYRTDLSRGEVGLRHFWRSFDD